MIAAPAECWGTRHAEGPPAPKPFITLQVARAFPYELMGA